MLTADLIHPFLRTDGRTLWVERLEAENPQWQQTASDLIALLQANVGQTRRAWNEAVRRYEGTRTDYLRLRGLAKVLSDEATLTPRTTTLPPGELRQHLFALGPVFAQPDIFHTLTRDEVLHEVAAEQALTPQDVEQTLFADHPDDHLITEAGPEWTATSLLHRYDLELVRGALYRAVVVQIEVFDHFKTMWSYLKLFKIMFLTEEIAGGGYRITLSGPLSDFVETERYGVAFAQFLPALLLAERWRLVARVRPPTPKATSEPTTRSEHVGQVLLSFRLDPSAGLQSHYRLGRVFDSALERTFASEFLDFEEKFGEARGKWRLAREDEVLVLDGTVMIPDFSLTHTQDAQRRILVELVGFWSPRYLSTKLAKARAARCSHLLLVVYELLNVTKADFVGIEGEVLFFKQKPVLKEVMAVVEQMAERVYGPLVLAAPVHPPLGELASACARVLAEREQSPWLSPAELVAALQDVYPAFAPRIYGASTIGVLIRSHPEWFEVRRGPAKGRPLQVCPLLVRASDAATGTATDAMGSPAETG